MKRLVLPGLLGLLLCAALARPAAGQDLEPRAYSASPVGLNFLVAAFGRSTGSIIFDPSIPITDVSARVNSFTLGYARTFGLLGRQAQISAAIPYAWGDMEGNVGEAFRRITRYGLADSRVRLAVNLYGSPAQAPMEFAKSVHGILIGSSLTIQIPTGYYHPSKLVNLGTNRWAFRPEAGVSVPIQKFQIDAYAGAWFFTDNPDFYPGGNVRSVKPLTSVQLHGSYTVRPGLWVAVDGTWYGGGQSSTNGGPPSERLSNSRVGVTVSVPIAKKQSIKAYFNKGAVVRAGQDFTTWGVAYQLLWF